MANHESMWITVFGKPAAREAFAEIADSLEKTRREHEFGDTRVIGKVLFGVEEMTRSDDRLGGGASWVYVEEADSVQISLAYGWRLTFGISEEIFRSVIQHDDDARFLRNSKMKSQIFVVALSSGLKMEKSFVPTNSKYLKTTRCCWTRR